MNQPYIYIYPLPFGLPSHWSHHSALSRVPWAPQYVLISCLFYACILSRFSHAQLFATLWTVAHSPGSSVHGIVQARTLEWVTMPFSKGSSQPRDRIHVSYVSCIGRRVLDHSTAGKPSILYIASIVYICQSQFPNSSHHHHHSHSLFLKSLSGSSHYSRFYREYT